MLHRILTDGQIERVIALGDEADYAEDMDEMRKYYDWYTDIMQAVTQSDVIFISFLRRSRFAQGNQDVVPVRPAHIGLWEMWIDELLAEQPAKKRYRDETVVDLSLLLTHQPQNKLARVSTMGLLSSQIKVYNSADIAGE